MDKNFLESQGYGDTENIFYQKKRSYYFGEERKVFEQQANKTHQH